MWKHWEVDQNKLQKCRNVGQVTYAARKAQDLEESLFEENDMDLERLNIS